jgi:EAL domain-containing protein (putative c-di-GMP-specific phosphodiesterase class I)
MRQTKIWRDEQLFHGPIAVNLSPRQLADPDFIRRFRELLKSTQTQADWFELEITENAMVDNLDVTLKRMEELNRLGVGIAIDDFGTGYSSLNYLRTFPVSTLKIDLTFVRDLPDDDRAVAVARTVLSLGHGLGLQVVAEGVENTEQLDFLKLSGCDVIQGYLIDRPLLAEEFANMIRAKS